MKRILFLPWMLILHEQQQPTDNRQGAYARQVPRYLSLRLGEVDGLETQFVPYCMESAAGKVFVVSGRKQSVADLRAIGRQYAVDVVVGGQAIFAETAEIVLQVVQVERAEQQERTMRSGLSDGRSFLATLLHLLLLELQPAAAAPGRLTCAELSPRWPAVSAFLCAIDHLMAQEINGGAGDLQVVFDLLLEALEHDPTWEEGAEQLIGTALEASADDAKGREAATCALERLVEKRGDLQNAWEALGALYFQSEQYGKAIVCLEIAMRLDPKRFASHHRLGATLREAGRDREAETVLCAGLARDPENIPLLNEMGVVLSHSGRAAAAVAFFQKAVDLSPISGAFYANLAVALQRAGMLIEAEEAFQRGMQAVDAHWNVYVNYAQFLKAQERHLDFVRVLFHGIQALVDQPTERFDLATRLVDGVREWSGAKCPAEIQAKGSGWIIALLESLIELLPGHQSSVVVLSEFYRQEGWPERALECLVRVEESDPNNVWLKVHIGSLLAGLGRHAEAMERFESVLDRSHSKQKTHEEKRAGS